MKLRPLNRREASKILEQTGDEFGLDAKSLLIDKYIFFISDKNKVYIMNNDIKDAHLENVRVNSFGLYFCELNRGNIRLSMEGSQMIGPKATKNILELSDEKAKQWLMGEDITVDQEFQGFVILKNKDDFLSAGKYKEGKMLNFVSKARRIKE